MRRFRFNPARRQLHVVRAALTQSARMVRMAHASPISDVSSAVGVSAVRLEVRDRRRRPAFYDLGDAGFLVGTVPGCDLRLPGAELPPVLCLIAHQPDGVTVRKLAPMTPLTVNGDAVLTTTLNDGDRIAVGGVEIVASIQGTPATADERVRLVELERDLTTTRAELERVRRETVGSDEQAAKAYQDALALKGEMTDIKRQLVEKFQERRQRLQAKETAVRRAALRVQERKRRLDQREAAAETVQQDWSLRLAELEARNEQVQRERKLLEEQARTLAAKQQDMQGEAAEQERDLAGRERRLADGRRALDQSEKLHQADLVRRDRLQALLEQRQRQLQARALEIDRRFEQMQRDSRDLEDQAAQLDEWHTRLAADTERLTKQKKDQDLTVSQIEQRAGVLEGQQTMLATLRTRLERTREELRREEQALTEQRAAQEATEAQLRQRVEETERLQKEVQAERQLLAEDLRQREERQATLDLAVAQLRQARETITAEEEQLRRLREQQEATAAEQAEQAGLLLARGTQLEELQQRLNADRQSMRERETNLTRAEQSLAALQDQVRKRSDELNERQRQVVEDEKRVQDETARLAAHGETLTLEHKQALERLEAQQAELTDVHKQFAEQQASLEAASQEIAVTRRALAEQQQALAAERLAWEAERHAGNETLGRTRSDVEAAATEARELAKTLPELEQRAAAALERLGRGRDQLREYLAEVHAFARQGRDDIAAARAAVRAEIERLREQETGLHAARDEHRLAVAAFRQQLIGWQAQVAEIRQSLRQDEDRIDRRQAEVDEKRQHVADTSARLARQAQELLDQERIVAGQRGEMNRHLADMREWYRKKLRELAGLDEPPDGDPTASAPPLAEVVPMPAPATAEANPDDELRPAAERGILSLTPEIDAGDRQLGDLLRSMELIDADTLAALLLEARRQRRSLRQLLLAGNYLTLYQIALIEAGNLHGLVLGPVRVIDRIRATPHEAVYRVFDPRGGREALLRHLAEAEMFDAVRPDEFRQRFAAAAALAHPNLSATFEVLEINGRPAVLQEWLSGVPSSEWPALAAAPGVWHRLLTQAAQGLSAAHGAGLTHGRLDASSFVLSCDGVLKLCGLGEPRWLAAVPGGDDGDASAAGDLAALGRVAAEWTALTAPRKGGKTKPLPDALQAILRRLTSDNPDERPAGAAALVEMLEQARGEIPGNATAWERFVRQVRERSADTALRESA
jgi:chromosome segregation ATPase